MHLTVGSRGGFTLAELVVTLAMLGLVVTLFLHTLASHQKIFRSFRQRILVSEQLREGRLALLGDMRGTAIRADTIRMLSDSAFEFFASIGSSVACRVNGQVVSLVPASLSSGILLSSMTFPPDTGDLFAVYTSPDSISGARRWVTFRISAVNSALASAACDPSSGFTSSADAANQAYRITLAGATDRIAAGASVRILRRGRYSLYRASEGGWYLGYKRCNAVATGCSTVQPVSGPYLSHSSGGLHFRYLDSLGGSVSAAHPLDVAAIEITLRSEVSAAGRMSGRAVDSAIALVSFRNIH